MAVPKVNLRKITRKKSTTYMLDFAVDGKRYRESVGSNRRTAELLQAKRQNDLTLGKFQIPVSSKKSISLDGIIKEYIATKKNEVRPNTIKRYENYFNRVREYCEEYFPLPANNIKLIKDSYIKEFINYMQEKEENEERILWSKKTVNGFIVTAKQLFNYAVIQGYLETNPLTEIKEYKISEKGKMEFFTDTELTQIWEKMDKYWIDPLQFILHTGLRKAEMINLKWENVILEEINPHIVITSDDEWQTKSGERRVIPLNKNALDIINRAKGKDKEYVFVSRNGMKIHPDKPYHAIKKALAKCNLSGDVHKLRHTFASRLVMSGRSLYDVSTLLGHSDTETTKIYAHLSPGHLRDAVTNIEE